MSLVALSLFRLDDESDLLSVLTAAPDCGVEFFEVVFSGTLLFFDWSETFDVSVLRVAAGLAIGLAAALEEAVVAGGVYFAVLRYKICQHLLR